jgi:hypothetical protein
MTKASDNLVERVARPVMAILWRREQYNGVSPDYETYRESMGGRVASYEREAEEIARAAIEATHLEGCMTRYSTEPTQFGDEVAEQMAQWYEAYRPLRWWERRRAEPGPRTIRLMYDLFYIATSAKPGSPKP